MIRHNTFNHFNSREYQQFMLASPDQLMISRNVSVRIYTLTELVNKHQRAGLEYVKYSDLYGNLLTFDTDEVLIISQKPK